MMKPGKVLVIAAAVIVAGGSAAGVLLLQHREPHRSGLAVAAVRQRGVPSSAESTVRLLLSARGRQALTPELSAVLPSGSDRLFPAGSTFTPSAGGWHQEGGFANVTGILRESGKAPMTAEIGLAERHGSWLVTFEGTP
jgi:hypothetical protein